MPQVADRKSVKVNKSTGTGMDIEWKDGHRSSYTFVFLRDACPCALCQEEREKDGRQPGDPLKPVAGALPMFKALARPTEVEPVGKYAIRFTWNDGHQRGNSCASTVRVANASSGGLWKPPTAVKSRTERMRKSGFGAATTPRRFVCRAP